MIIVKLVGTYTYNLLRRGSDYALFSMLMRLLRTFYKRVGMYNDGDAIYAATSEWNLQQCMTTYLEDDEEDTDNSDSDSDDPSSMGEGQDN
jgi:hypothetical protein